MNILFGEPEWYDWKDNFELLPYNVFVSELNDIEVVLSYIRNNKIDVLIPSTIEQMLFVINNKDILLNNVRYICGNEKEPIKLLNSKIKFANFMQSHNLEEYIPQTFITKYGNNFNDYSNIKYPCILKLDKSCGGYKIVVLLSVNNLRCILPHYHENYIIQEYITSPNEYSGNFYVENGIIKWYVFYMMVNNNKYYVQQGKMKTYIRIENNSLDFCLDIFNYIFNKLNYKGFACADFKIIANILKIFEINPRLGGTIVNNNNDFANLMMNLIYQDTSCR